MSPTFQEFKAWEILEWDFNYGDYQERKMAGKPDRALDALMAEIKAEILAGGRL